MPMLDESNGVGGLDRSLEVVTLLTLACGLVWLATVYPEVPSRVPRHFGADGAADAWGSKSILWILAGVTVFLYLLLTLVSRMPRYFNYPVRVTAENQDRLLFLARRLLRWLKLEIVLMFSWIGWRTVEVAHGRAEGLSPLFLLLVLAGVLGTSAVYFIRMVRAR